MPIIRRADSIERVEKLEEKVQRSIDDWDLAWEHYRIYVLDAHEWFVPHTWLADTRKDGAKITTSNPAMYGPSVVVVSHNTDQQVDQTTEYHINDPFIWKFIQKRVRQ